MLRLISGIFGGATMLLRGVTAFTGDKVQREGNVHEEQMAAHGALAAEVAAQIRETRTWWDSLVDGLNRLPRPLMALAVIALFAWPVFDPVEFSVAMQAFALVPEWLALVMAQVVLLFFGGRALDKLSFKGPSAEEVGRALDNMERIRALRNPEVRPSPQSSPLAPPAPLAPSRANETQPELPGLPPRKPERDEWDEMAQRGR